MEFEVAKAAANNPADFDLKMNMFNHPQSSKPGARTRTTDDAHVPPQGYNDAAEPVLQI